MPAAKYSEEFKEQVVRGVIEKDRRSPRLPRRITLSPRR